MAETIKTKEDYNISQLISNIDLRLNYLDSIRYDLEYIVYGLTGYSYSGGDKSEVTERPVGLKYQLEHIYDNLTEKSTAISNIIVELEKATGISRNNGTESPMKSVSAASSKKMLLRG